MAAVAQNYTSNYTLFIKYNATEGYLEALERQKNDRPGKALNFIGTFQKKKKKKIAMPSSRSNIKKRVLVTLTYLESQWTVAFSIPSTSSIFFQVFYPIALGTKTVIALSVCA